MASLNSTFLCLFFHCYWWLNVLEIQKLLDFLKAEWATLTSPSLYPDNSNTSVVFAALIPPLCKWKNWYLNAWIERVWQHAFLEQSVSTFSCLFINSRMYENHSSSVILGVLPLTTEIKSDIFFPAVFHSHWMNWTISHGIPILSASLGYMW